MTSGTISLSIQELRNMEEGLVSPHWNYLCKSNMENCCPDALIVRRSKKKRIDTFITVIEHPVGGRNSQSGQK